MSFPYNHRLTPLLLLTVNIAYATMLHIPKYIQEYIFFLIYDML